MEASSALTPSGDSLGEAERRKALEHLLAQAQRGDTSAFGHLAGRYWQYLLSIASRELSPEVRTRVAPSDLVQETLIRAQEGLARFNGSSDEELRGWLRAILLYRAGQARRQNVDCKKRNVRREVHLDQNSAMAAEHLPAAQCETPSRHMAAQEDLARLWTAIDNLPLHYRQVLIMRNMDRKKFQVIAAELGSTPDAVRKLWVRAVQLLRQELSSESGSIARG